MRCYNHQVVEILVPLFALTAFFSPILYGMKRRYDLKEKQLQAPAEPKLLTEMAESTREVNELRDQNQLLQERIENLEAIVCNVDYELNQRLANLPSQPALLALAGQIPQTTTDGQDDDDAPSDNRSDNPNLADRPAKPAAGDGTRIDRSKRGAALASTMPAPGELSIGRIINNRYRIERLLGRGGMGAVYLAHDEVLDDSVALKVISTHVLNDDKSALERFRREASTARKISALNVIRIHDIGETEYGQAYISMEYFAGKPLAQLLNARGTLDADDGHDILAQMCDGLQAAHNAGVIHRDLKPQNVLVGARNAVKIIDFGLAKSSFMPELTATGLIMGTPHYMSPEQVRGRQIDARSDIYSLGAVTYHALTGRPPFDGKTPIAIGFAHCSESPTPPNVLRPTLSDGLNEMILACLAKKPADRPQSAIEVRDALDA